MTRPPPLLRVNAFRSLPRRAGTANVSQKGTTSYTYSLGVSSIESLHQSTQLARNIHTQQIYLHSHSIHSISSLDFPQTQRIPPVSPLRPPNLPHLRKRKTTRKHNRNEPTAAYDVLSNPPFFGSLSPLFFDHSRNGTLTVK